MYIWHLIKCKHRHLKVLAALQSILFLLENFFYQIKDSWKPKNIDLTLKVVLFIFTVSSMNSGMDFTTFKKQVCFFPLTWVISHLYQSYPFEFVLLCSLRTFWCVSIAWIWFKDPGGTEISYHIKFSSQH